MYRKFSLILLLIIQVAIYSIAVAQDEENDDLTGKTIISTVDNLRIRETSDTNSKISGHINTGDNATVKERSRIKSKVNNKENYWYKIKIASVEGWVFGSLITDNFQMSSDGNIVLWYEAANTDDQQVPVYYYNRKTKKKNSYKVEGTECTGIELSPDGKYYAQDCGTSGIRGLTFYLAETNKNIVSVKYTSSDKWSGMNEMNISAVLWNTETCSSTTDAVFKDGKVTYGKKVTIEGGCSNVYIIIVPNLKIYDSPGGKGKVIGIKKKDDIVELDNTKDNSGEWINIYYEDNNAYVLKKELRESVKNENKQN